MRYRRSFKNRRFNLNNIEEYSYTYSYQEGFWGILLKVNLPKRMGLNRSFSELRVIVGFNSHYTSDYIASMYRMASLISSLGYTYNLDVFNGRIHDAPSRANEVINIKMTHEEYRRMNKNAI